MKKRKFILVLAVIVLAVFLPTSLKFNPAYAQESEYTIENVDHQIELMYSGNVVIRDTVTVSGQIPNGFLIGFPYKYGASVLKAMAFSTDQIYPMSLDVRLGNQSGFYGAEVTFPEGSPNLFTVVFILANELLTKTSEGFSLDFPAYPSLAKTASRCNVTVVLSDGSTISNITKEDGIVTTRNFVTENLPALAYFPATASIVIPQALIRKIAITSLDRIVTVGPVGEITFSDTYNIVNNSSENIGSVKIDVPANASNISGKDSFGRVLPVKMLSDTRNPLAISVNVTLSEILQGGKSAGVEIEYNLPTLHPDQLRFALNLELPALSYYIYFVSITVIPPEGAHIVVPQLSSADPHSSLDRELFQETARINREGVSYMDLDAPVENILHIVYDYNPLWLSLRPTIWVWVLAAVGIVVGTILRRPRSQTPPKAQVQKVSARTNRDRIRAFIEAFEERGRISEEMQSLAARSHKGKMQRRQYKVQRRALELRYDSLSKQVNEAKGAFRNAGGNLANLVKQLDGAESELTKIEAKIRKIEAHRRTSGVALEEDKQALDDLRKRKEKADSAIDAILMRVREESH